jgi:hypothetical protein
MPVKLPALRGGPKLDETPQNILRESGRVLRTEGVIKTSGMQA